MDNNCNLTPKMWPVFFKSVLIIFLVEACIMYFFNILELAFSPYMEAFVDALLLVFLSIPLIILWVVSPFKKALQFALRDLCNYKYAMDQHAILAVTDKKGKIIDVNSLFCKLSGYSEEELIGKTHKVINSGYHPKAFWKELYNTISAGKVWKGQIINKSKNGELYWVETTIVPFLDEKQSPIQYIAIRTDITDLMIAKKQLKDAEQRTALATQTSNIGIWEWNLVDNTVKWDTQMFNIYGLAPTEDYSTQYSDWSNSVLPEELAEQERILKETAQSGGTSERTFKIRRYGDEKIRVIHAKETVRLDAKGNPEWLVGTNVDITENIEIQEKIKQLAMTDHLTGLANRHKFNEQFEQYAELAKRHQITLSMILIDLDHFKPVNDTYGHIIGDKLLTKVAEILKQNSRAGDIVARLGGDEFAILMVNPGANENIARVAERIIVSLSDPFFIDGHEIVIGASIGIANFSHENQECDDLMHQADLALYTAKNQGRNQYRFALETQSN